MKCPEVQFFDIDMSYLGHLLKKISDSYKLLKHAQDITRKLLECHTIFAEHKSREHVYIYNWRPDL